MNQYLWMILGDKFKEVTLFDVFNFKQFLHNGIKVLVGDAILMTGEMYGCVLDEETEEYFVVIDEDYTKNASSEEISFFLYHELGHATLRHTFEDKENGFSYHQRDEYTMTGRIFTIEREADDYAVSEIGAETCLKGLIELPKRMSNEFGVMYHSESPELLEAHLRVVEIIKKEREKGVNIFKKSKAV